MKNLSIALAALALLLNLSSCKNAAAEPRIADDVTEMEVTHFSCAGAETRTVQGDELKRLQAWANGLKCQVLVYKEEDSPGNQDGGEGYTFAWDDSEFSYVIHGANRCYLLVEGQWYSVVNPSAPPVSLEGRG